MQIRETERERKIYTCINLAGGLWLLIEQGLVFLIGLYFDPGYLSDSSLCVCVFVCVSVSVCVCVSPLKEPLSTHSTRALRLEKRENSKREGER